MRLGKGFVALVAVMTGFVIGPGPATAGELHSDSTTLNTFLTGTQTGNHLLHLAGGTLKCNKVTVAGTIAATTVTAFRLQAGYSECTFFGVAVTVSMGQCQFEVTADGGFAIIDKEEADCGKNPVTFRATVLGTFSCHIEIVKQVGLSGLTYGGASKTEAEGAVTTSPNVSEITYRAQGELCGETGTLTNGTYPAGPISLKGYVDQFGLEGPQTPIWIA